MGNVVFIYPVHNRLDYNKITLPLILEEVRTSESVKALIIFDDMSEDGTSEWIQSLPIADFIGKPFLYQRTKIGNSTSQWNRARELIDGDYYANFCNDNLIPLGICDLFANYLDGQSDVFGIGGKKNVNHTYPFIEPEKPIKDVTERGNGMYRGSVFKKYRDVTPSVLKEEERFFGFTAYQERAVQEGHKIKNHTGVHIVKLSRSPIYSRLNEYHDKGYTRKVYDCPDSIFNL